MLHEQSFFQLECYNSFGKISPLKTNYICKVIAGKIKKKNKNKKKIYIT
jgi:hypothetical protein